MGFWAGFTLRGRDSGRQIGLETRARKTDWAGNTVFWAGEWADMGGHGRGMGVCVGLAEIGNVSEGRSVGNRAGVGNGRGSFTKSGS